MTIHSTHQTQARVAEVGKFKKQLTLTDLTFIGLGAIFGSAGCLPQNRNGIDCRTCGHFSWVIGGIAVLLLGLSIVSWARHRLVPGDYPLSGLSHGELMGYLLWIYYADCVFKPSSP